MSPVQQLTIEQAISQAKEAVRQGNVAVARQLYSMVLQYQPNHSIATQGLRQLQKELPNHQSQQTQTAKPSRDQINALVNLYHSGQMTKVVQACEELLQTYPQSLIILNLLGAMLVGQGQFQQAVQVFDQVIQLKPDNADVYCNRGNALTGLGQLEAAIDSCDQSIQLKPDFAGAYSTLLFNLQYKTDFDPKYYLSQAQKFRLNCRPQRKISPSTYSYQKNPTKLKIGLVSSDFGNYPGGYFSLSTL